MPAISIVTATYNRSNVLRHAIASVLRQSFTDWEMLVVSDGCTDDTAAVVASFGDPRLRFVHLARNHGEQSAPNNEGARLATGTWLAYLNHDDLWFSDHLQTLHAAITDGQADLVYALSAQPNPNGSTRLWGYSPGGSYAPWHGVPASVWLMRRTLLERVGPWTSARQLWNSPSQDWLRRAHAAGARLQPVSKLTVVQISSGNRRGSYSNRDEHEHLVASRALEQEQAYREALLTAIAQDASPLRTALQPLVHVRRGLSALFWRACVAAGIPPASAVHVLRYGRRGGFIRHLRRTRGLTPTIGHPS